MKTRFGDNLVGAVVEVLKLQLRDWKKRALTAEKIVAAARERNRKNLVEWRKARKTGKKRRPPGRPKAKQGRRK